jgi:cellulose synthase/poly-beta-1,6-N-acetylglucosamine synthase-like glycosyltransferase
MVLFSTILFGLAGIYAAAMGTFAWGFRRASREAPPPAAVEDDLPFVSVVVAARNEEESIAPCVESVLESDYPEERFEVIVVDDFSEDDTARRVEALQRKVNRALVPAGAAPPPEDEPERLRLVRMVEEVAGPSGHKHAALRRGLNRARGEILLTTDADCTVGPGWIRAMTRRFGANTAFVSGPVVYESSTPFGKVQALEALGLVALGAGAVGAGRPNLCNSANVAYRRSAYECWGRDLPTTPAADEMLIQRVAASREEVAFCADPAAAVRTEPMSTPGAFWQQRRRWAHAGGQYPDLALQVFVIVAYVFYALLLGGVALLPVWPTLFPAVGGALALKVAGEGALLTLACRRLRQSKLMRYFLPAQVMQIPYVVAVGAAGQFGKLRWKGRRVR